MADILDKITKFLLVALLAFGLIFYFRQRTANARMQKKIDQIDSNRINLERQVLRIQAATSSRDSFLVEQQKGYAAIIDSLNKSIPGRMKARKEIEEQLSASQARSDSAQKSLEKLQP